MRPERAVLLLAGVAVFVLGTWLHRDRASLAVALVVVGAVLGALGIVLPYLQNLQGEVAGVSVQIALARLPEPLSAEPLGELRGEVLPDSGAQAFIKLLRRPAASAYSVVSLVDGRQWLTSRLLVFAMVLQELRGTRCLVITRWLGDDGVDRFVGTVRPDDLCRAFAWRYPWLIAAMCQSWAAIMENQRPHGAATLTPEIADRLLHDTTHLLKDGPTPSAPAGDPEWADVRGRREHARWVDEATLAAALGDCLDQRRITVESVADVNPDDVLSLGGSFVPLVDHENRFLALLDRDALVEARSGRSSSW